MDISFSMSCAKKRLGQAWGQLPDMSKSAVDAKWYFAGSIASHFCR